MIEREQLREKQDEADALRKALEHEKQSHLETCNRENKLREIAGELAAALEPIAEHGGEVSFILTWKHVTDARTVLAKAKAAGISPLAEQEKC